MYWVACNYCGASWKEEADSPSELIEVQCPNGCFSHNAPQLLYVGTESCDSTEARLMDKNNLFEAWQKGLVSFKRAREFYHGSIRKVRK